MHRLILAIAFAALTACASQPESGPAMFERWIYAACWDQEEETGLTFQECIDDFVAGQCTAAGHQPETPAYRRCDTDTRSIAFAQNQYKLLRNSQPNMF